MEHYTTIEKNKQTIAICTNVDDYSWHNDKH